MHVSFYSACSLTKMCPLTRLCTLTRMYTLTRLFILTRMCTLTRMCPTLSGSLVDSKYSEINTYEQKFKPWAACSADPDRQPMKECGRSRIQVSCLPLYKPCLGWEKTPEQGNKPDQNTGMIRWTTVFLRTVPLKPWPWQRDLFPITGWDRPVIHRLDMLWLVVIGQS